MESENVSKKSYFLEILKKFEEASAQNTTELKPNELKNEVSSLESFFLADNEKTTSTTHDSFSESVHKQNKPELPPKNIKLTKDNEVLKKDDFERKTSSSSSYHKLLNASISSESNSSFSLSFESNNYQTEAKESNDKDQLTPTSKSHKVALELLQTEREYVARLKLIVEVYYKEIEATNNEEKYLPQGFHEKIFSNVKSIYMLHQDVFLPDIEKCLQNWGEGSSLGQVMIGMAPFLKFYTQYLMNLQQAFDVISISSSKSERFAEVLKNLEKSQDQDTTKGLGLRHLIQEPLSRIPRYKLLLTEFLKRLPEDSTERPIAEEALALVAQTAEHLNGEIRKMEDFKQLLEVTSCLVGSGCESLVSVNRKFISQGPITKTSARDGSSIKRHLFLFSDILLVCKEQPRLALNAQYLIKSCLDLYGMKVYDKEECTFFVMSKQKSVEFVAQSFEEKSEWIRLLWTWISHVTKTKIKIESDKPILFNNEEKFGDRAPVWVRDQEVSMCMLCCAGFNAFKRRHHCRACGKVVCGGCSTQEAKLHYAKDRLQRVCDNCIKRLNPGIFTNNQKSKLPSALRMQGDSEDGVLKDYMQVSGDNKNYTGRWLVLTSDGALYFFKAPKDNAAIDSLTLPGHEVNMEEGVVKVSHPHLKKCTYVTNQDPSTLQQWHSLLSHAAEGNLPLSKALFRSSVPSNESCHHNTPPVSRDLSSTSSNVFLDHPPSDTTAAEATT